MARSCCALERLCASAALLALLATPSSAVSISNVLPRVDTAGRILDAHDGNVLYDATTGTFLLYAAGYGNCREPQGTLNGCADWSFNDTGCGFLNNHTVQLFTSTDLVTWTSEGNVLPVRPPPADVVLFSPKAIHDDARGVYVLWYNFVPSYSYAVATSSTRAGPFTTTSTMTGNSTQYGAPNNSGVGDMALFKDDDGAGYLMYSANAHVQVEPLSGDYTHSLFQATGRTSGPFPHGNEAPAMFKRDGVYYALVSDSCCYCGEGGQVHAYSAPSPLGPYAYLGEITRGPNPFNGTVSTSAQQTNVFRVPSRDPTRPDSYVWQGDRWQSAPDGLKAHDYTYWSVLSFTGNGSVVPIQWQDAIEVDDV